MTGENEDSLQMACLARLVDRLRSYFPALVAIMLGGSYGRGEGVLSSNGSFVNDLDVTLVFSTTPSFRQRSLIRKARRELEIELALPHLDLMFETPSSLQLQPLTMARYDLLNHGRTLWQSPQFVPLNSSQVPPFPPGEIVNLLVNRAVTLLEGHPEVAHSLSDKSKLRQLAKVYWAIADSTMYKRGAYRTLYKEKMDGVAGDAHTPDEFSDLLPLMKSAWSMSLPDAEVTPEVLFQSWLILRKYYLVEVRDTIPSPSLRNPRALSKWKRLLLTLSARARRRSVKWRVEEKMLSSIDKGIEDAHDVSRARELVSLWYQS